MTNQHTKDNEYCDCGDPLSGDFVAWLANQFHRSLTHQMERHGADVVRFTLLIDDPDGKTVVGISSPSVDLENNAERHKDLLDAKARAEKFLAGLNSALEGGYWRVDGIGSPKGSA